MQSRLDALGEARSPSGWGLAGKDVMLGSQRPAVERVAEAAGVACPARSCPLPQVIIGSNDAIL